MFSVYEEAYKRQEYIVRIRRILHEYPELSGKEHHTREVIIHELELAGIPFRLLKGTGVLARIDGKHPGYARLLRADIDALPIQEDLCNLKRPKESVSSIPGVCHACGHDAHTAVLLAAAGIIHDHFDELYGTVYLCFEEGEETGCGVDVMLEALEDLGIRECFALHVYAGLDSGIISLQEGPRMAGRFGLDVTFRGKAGHSSRPDKAVNPIIAGAHFITVLDSLFRSGINPETMVTLGITQVTAGETDNIIPEECRVRGCGRFFQKEEGEKAVRLIRHSALHTAEIFGCGAVIDPCVRITMVPVCSDKKITERVRKTLEESCKEVCTGVCEKWYASESFSKYLEKYPGVFAFLGIRNEEYGSGAEHHSGKFDIDESGLWIGAAAEIAFVMSGGKEIC